MTCSQIDITRMAASAGGRHRYASTMIRLARCLAVVTMASGMAILGNTSAQAEESTDLSVHLAHVGYLGDPGHFDLSITNHGSDPLQSATVTLHATRFLLSAPTPCTSAFVWPSTTLTCQFGSLPVGTTVTVPAFPALILSVGTSTQHVLTLTRVASTPADPNPTNDTATKTCTSWYSGSPLQDDFLFCH